MEATIYTNPRWDCPFCGNVNETEIDAGHEEQCNECGTDVKLVLE
jgi:hypothetical protein